MSQKDASAAVQSVFDTIATALQSGDKVQLIGFGTFEVRERSARTGRNPQTGEEIQIAAGKVPAFKAGKELKEAVK
ncbi:HU family DNA-binding protein [Bacillus anthracis]|uniref:HU family DNA-binding protein n=1 Tax=Bacillus anthracis TaxID=1392 RepID=UPI003C30900C